MCWVCRWLRLAPLIMHLFPQTALGQGAIDSPLLELCAWPSPAARARIGLHGRVLLKADSELPVCGSVKVRPTGDDGQPHTMPMRCCHKARPHERH